MQFRELIDVRPPYFAFQSVASDEPGTASALVRSEQPLGHEEGPLSGAEAGRHLAILGACACSSVWETTGTHFYLARRAKVVRHPHVVGHGNRTFRGFAQATGARSGREASAHGTLFVNDSDRPVFTIDVTYQVLSRNLFQRVFASRRVDMRARPRADSAEPHSTKAALRQNPYYEHLPLEFLERGPERVRACVSGVSASHCAGHFPQYPALPVAVLMHALTTMSGEALRVRWGDSARFRIVTGDVHAERLVFPGESLLLDAEFLRATNAHETYRSSARLADGTRVGELLLELIPS
jgi:hypothetical protein